MAIKTPPCLEWSIREQLCLASAVMRSGDQNWMTVSRAIKPFPEPGRPPDWNKPKYCAIQYSTLLAEVDSPKRKRSGDKRDIVEAPGDLIVKKMTFDRVEELKTMIADDKRKFKLLRDDIELIESGALDEKLPEILQDIHDLRKKRVAEAQKLAAEAAAAEIQDKKEQKEKLLLLAAYNAARKQLEPVKKAVSVIVPAVAVKQVSDVCHEKKVVTDVTKAVSVETKAVSVETKAVRDVTKDVSGVTKDIRDVTKAVCDVKKVVSEVSAKEVLTASKEEDTAKLVKTSPPLPKPTTPGHAPVLTNLLVTEKKEAKRINLTPEILSDIQSILAKPNEDDASKVAASQTAAVPEAHGPAEKGSSEVHPNKTETPTLSKLLSSTKSYQGQHPAPPSTVEAVEVKPVPIPTKEVTPPEKIPTIVEVDTKEEVEVAIIEEILPESPSTLLLICKPGLENEDSSDISVIASAGPSSPVTIVRCEEPSSPVTIVRCEEQKKRKRGRPKKKRVTVADSNLGQVLPKTVKMDLEDDNMEIQSVGESADETKDDTRSEAAESEETERPSESDRDDMSGSNLTLPGSFVSESLPNSPASFTQPDDHQRSWKKAIMLVWREAASHKFANLFLNPVTDDIAPGYTSVVYRRMDLSTIKKNIEAGVTKNVETFQRDIMVMFQNAIMYNRSDQDVYRMAVYMQNDVLKSIEEFKSTQLLVQNPEVSKILRGRDRRADISQKDDEKKRSTLDPEHLTGKKRRTRADEV